jgi:ribosomal protein S18 acetylase RimI-like enzyme
MSKFGVRGGTMSDLRIERYDDCPGPRLKALSAFVDDVELAGKRTDQPYSVCLCDADGTLVGGATGVTAWGFCELNSLGIGKRFRRQGWGRKLVEAVAQTARERDCRIIQTSTMSFQAIDFYRHIGFVVLAELTDASGTYTRYFLAKKLT